MNSFWQKLIWLMRRPGKEAQLSEELSFHLEEEARERSQAGMSDEAARLAARREFGNLTLVREETRAAWGWTLVEHTLQDLRYGFRNILRNPAFAALAALSLALGIGANTAIYSLMDAMLMRSLPVRDPDSLVVLRWRMGGKKKIDESVIHHVSGHIDNDPRYGLVSGIFPYPAFTMLRKSDGPLSSLFAYRPARKLNVILDGQAQVTNGEYVSGEYFGGLNIGPAAGRLLTEYDDAPGAPGAVTVSYGLAQRQFGDAKSAVGQTAIINNTPFTVVGVTPPEFFGVDPAKAPEVYLPLHADLTIDLAGRDSRYLDPTYYATEMMGRLRPGVTIAQAQSALSPMFAAWVAGTASNDAERRNLPEFLLQSGAMGLDTLRRDFSEPLYLLLGMVGLILAIACANIANLLLARSSARRREMAVRLSIGAGRWRIARQMLTESLLLAAIGGAGGILVGVWGIRFLISVLSSGGESFPLHAELNAGVLAVSALVTMLTGALFGLAPAMQATRVDPLPALTEARAGGAGSRRGRRFGLGSMLVAGQMAICLLLLVGAGLFVETLTNLQHVEMGFDRSNVLLFKVNAKQAGHSEPEIRVFYSNLERRLAAIPGVRSAAMADSPLIGDGAWGWAVVPVGAEKPANAPTGHGSGSERESTRVLGTGPGFFATMGIPMLAGRAFDERDRAGTAIVNEAWAKVNLDGASPVGRRVISYGLSDKAQELEIVGLAKNTRYDDLIGKFPAIVYLPAMQNPQAPVDEMTYFLRTSGDPLNYAGAVREVVRQADARIPVAGLTSQTAQIENEMAQESLFARLVTAFALLALTIACVGLYGTASYAVARRTGEIGIRMALGAPRRAVLWMVLRDVLTLAAVGMAVSLPLAWAASQVVQSLLYEVKPGDPVSMAGAATILLFAALAAGYVPALRASRIDPMTAVRHE